MDDRIQTIHSSFFVENEPTPSDPGHDVETIYDLRYQGVKSGSLFGTVRVGQTAVATFVLSELFTLQIVLIGTPLCKPLCGTFDALQGRLKLCWDGPPGPTHVVASYEVGREYTLDCDMDCETSKEDTPPTLADRIRRHGEMLAVPGMTSQNCRGSIRITFRLLEELAAQIEALRADHAALADEFAAVVGKMRNRPEEVPVEERLAVLKECEDVIRSARE